MLDTLHIRNFALVGDIVLPWKPGLNVLTGETGAGKSIIVDAMSLLLGERAAVASIRDGADQAEIEALRREYGVSARRLTRHAVVSGGWRQVPRVALRREWREKP